ncbi:MCP four helix bundle domain-containing protein, partial [Bradyrhizobium sp. CCH5-F6]|uniref:MCP four helix bundle domain-containing protein n=1 Tax=Bradyrhizobium sp. CCH5-F6 TaxID=1768753 RepID=UPI000769D5CB
MRFTVKAKLAAAFSTIIVLSMATGGIAYMKLTQLSDTSESLVQRAARIDKAGELQNFVFYQTRAEREVIIASTDQEMQKIADEIKQYRKEATRLRDEIYSVANATGRQLLDKFTVAYDKMNATEDTVVKFGMMNSNNRGAQLWAAEGQPVRKAWTEAVDAVFAEVSRTASSPERGDALMALQNLRLEGAQAQRQMTATFSASSMDELGGEMKELGVRTDAFQNAARHAGASLKSIGISSASLTAQTDSLIKVITRVGDVVKEGGNIRAAALAASEGKANAAEAISTSTDYINYVKKVMSELAGAAAQEAANAKLVLLSIIVASLVIAAGSAVWIAVNISRGLARAVGLADAVSIGDLSQKIDVSSNDEVGDLVKSLNKMTANLNATAALANEIAQGNLTIEAKPLSDKDTLGLALERMVEKLRQIVSEALTAAQNVSAGSQELSASAEQLSQGATEQASSAEEASSSMEEMASNVKQNADNA